MHTQNFIENFHCRVTLVCDSRFKLFCTNSKRVRTNIAFFSTSRLKQSHVLGSVDVFENCFVYGGVWYCNVYTFGLRAYVTFIQNGNYNENLSHTRYTLYTDHASYFTVEWLFKNYAN